MFLQIKWLETEQFDFNSDSLKVVEYVENKVFTRNPPDRIKRVVDDWGQNDYNPSLQMIGQQKLHFIVAFCMATPRSYEVRNNKSGKIRSDNNDI